MARRVSLEIVGDSSSLEKAFADAADSARKFNQQVGTGTRYGRAAVADLDAQTAATKRAAAADEELIKVRSRRASSLGPFRLAGVGLGTGAALFAATQVVRELGASIETVGEAAFTTEGRLKNMVSALTSGNLVGAVKALTRVPKELEDLGITEATFIPADRLAALELIANRSAKSLEDFKLAGEDTFETFARAAKIAETADAGLAQKILDVVDAQNLNQNVTRGMEDAQRTFNRTLWDGTSALVEYKHAADDVARLRGPGGIALEQSSRQPRRAMPEAFLSPSQRRELDLIGQEGTERLAGLQDRLRQLQAQLKRGTSTNEQRLRISTKIRNTEAEIAAIYADQAAKVKAAAEDRKRAAEAAAAEARRRREEARAAELARELRILEGPIPTRGNLAEQFEQLQKSAAADKDFPKKLTERFAGVARLLREEIMPETREAIQAFFETVRGEFDKGAADADPLAGLMQVSSKRMAAILAAGTGLGGAGLRTLTGNISGAQLQPMYIGVNIDGREVGRATTKDQTRTGKRTGRQTSGRRA